MPVQNLVMRLNKYKIRQFDGPDIWWYNKTHRGHGGELATGVGWHTAFISAVFEQIEASLKHRLQGLLKHVSRKGQSLVRSDNGRKP